MAEKKFATKFAGNVNPFTGHKLTDMNIEICNDPFVIRKTTGSIYDELFDKLKIGQCLKCKADDVDKTVSALRTYVKRKQLKAKVKSTEMYTNVEPKGRIWLLPN